MLSDFSQLEQVTKYQDKWRSLYLQCNSCDQEKVENAVKVLYTAMGLSQPKIEFWSSPSIASKHFNLDDWGDQLIRIDEPIEIALKQELNSKLWQKLHSKIYEPLHQQIWTEIGIVIYELLRETYTLWHDLNKPIENKESYFNPVMDFTTTDYLIARGCLFDYAYEVLNYQKIEQIWQSYRYLAINCGWLLTYQHICLICDRPNQLRVNKEMKLHNLVKPAILLNDGVSVYAYKGEILPAKYGDINPSAWQINWILEERNPYIRRILVEGISYKRICRRKPCKELDKLGDSTLLEIDLYDDDRPARLLKIKYVDIDKIDIIRVPPHIDSVKEAIIWVNWGHNIKRKEFYSLDNLRSYF
ncbi:MAG: DUF6745 domain-containing protein [Cyanobacteria bacterium P01_F01_bin.143]